MENTLQIRSLKQRKSFGDIPRLLYGLLAGQPKRQHAGEPQLTWTATWSCT